MEINTLKYIDSLRWIAILLVLIVHSTLLLPLMNINPVENIQKLLWFWQYGVILFFLVSSYTLFRSLDLKKEKNKKYFFKRRFFRIAPLYYIIIIILFFTTSWIPYYLGDNTNISLSNLLLHIFFLNWFFSNTYNSIIWVEWTIFVEVWFYLLLPIIYSYRKHINKFFIFFIIIALLSFLSLNFFNLTWLKNLVISKSPLIQFLAFIPWCYIYIYEKNNIINNFFIN